MTAPPLSPRRIGLFGGSFDPPHVGHLLVAQDAIEALGLDLLLVVPVARQPLKEGHGASAAHRLAMVRAAFDGVPRVAVDPVEIERGGLSYTVDTVRSVRARHPDAELVLLLGADAAPSWPRWHQAEALAALVRVAVLQRPGVAGGTPAGQAEGRVSGVPPGSLVLPSRCVEVSSTEVRERVRAGKSLRGFVPEAVAAYITGSGIYQEDPRGPVAGVGPARA